MPARQTAPATRTAPNGGRRPGVEFPKAIEVAPPKPTNERLSGDVTPQEAQQEAEQRAATFAEQAKEADPSLIAEVAYQIYLDRGSDDGDELSDWLEAERRIRGSRNDFDR